MSLPDVVSDHVVEQVFYKAAEDAGFTNPQDVARCRHQQWARQGFHALPPYVQSFVLRACNGEVQ